MPECLNKILVWIIFGGKTIGSTPKKFSVGGVTVAPVVSEGNYYNILAKQAVHGMRKNSAIDVKTFDPLTIWLIIQIIYQVVKCYIGKKKTPAQALEIVNDPNFAHKLLLKRMVLKAIRDQGRNIGSASSQSAFKTELYEQLLKMGQNGTTSDLRLLENDLPEIAKHFEGETPLTPIK